MMMSLMGIIFGIGFFVLAQAQTSGFESFFKRTILGVNGSIRITDRLQETLSSIMASSDEQSGVSFVISAREGKQYVEGVDYPDQLREALEDFPEVTGVSEVLEGRIDVTSGFRAQPARVYGIRLKDHIRVSNLDDHLIDGQLSNFERDVNSVLIGSLLARRLEAKVGDYVVIRTGQEDRRYQIAGVYETGIEDVDKQRIYMQLGEVRSLLYKPFGGAFLQVNIANPDKAPHLAAHMERLFGHHVVSWQEREQVWLEVFRALKVSSAITVSTIILISGLGMFNTLAMMVMEKNRDIAILRSMGFTRRDIAEIFIFQGGIILALGTALGSLCGVLATYGISKIPLHIRGVFSTDRFVVEWSWEHYLYAALIASIVIFLASIIPARRAARLEPGSIIRGTSL
ncbi:MAG: ABC transporter permease [Opitutales bacterium]